MELRELKRPNDDFLSKERKKENGGSRTTVIYDKEGHAPPSWRRCRPAEGRGEPRTIERSRVRARFVDQAEVSILAYDSGVPASHGLAARAWA